MIVFPAIDIIEGKCVRLTQGDYKAKTIYHDKPADMAKMVEDEGFTHLHVVDLDGAQAGAIRNWRSIEEITKSTNLKVDVGGGIKTASTIESLLELGVKQVNLGSIAHKAPELVQEWMEQFGNNTIIISADVRDEKIAVHGWQNQSTSNVFDFIKNNTWEKATITCTDIQTDGMLSGPNVSLYAKLIQQFPHANIIASGGVGNIEHIRTLKEVGVFGVIVGKAIYENKISLKELQSYAG
ncbi:MAG: 1-(5-phosphoribosyl)-5-[(5-phosphoribosylamino)methylideneamino]imidazole-4-carboxamide isomerase [Cyclobacteriaceae bacterium]|jgi:phosphoribosylformimino-5-aminoimidazole carboxamide ribotide isomerase|nr:1-(5-phosphoribosyl)-5-[(5-phosphoribosylamino)methylideneamino]imidazole-4-carboxamide isomerase [Flammeovirgaceae bacterium]MCZ8022418.1 1-(5-phosphoribosyl)-5-[(5-phosphoribosylamino)methylideneamino]imidazole-4-carboxamide isomerase [Cytophagales bacterium]MCZ8327502.1 1-(5-phosphoribosyl)-5-[(5-phosphoribosylamino)methylideneamino]imidazole-4-carboxamide isomerase [Cyclobacteriaceae bacterium]